MNYETPEKYLETLAIKEQTRSYTQFAQYFGWDVPKPAQWKLSNLGMFIADITDEDVKLGRPLRSAVLVRAREQTPGRGFFAAYSHARAANLISTTDRVDAWINERRRAATYSWRTVSGLNVKGFQFPAVVQPARVSRMPVHGH